MDDYALYRVKRCQPVGTAGCLYILCIHEELVVVTKLLMFNRYIEKGSLNYHFGIV